MNQKEKAKSLTQNFYGRIATQSGEVPLEWDKAKLCAIFHCDEMIKVVKEDYWTSEHYWQEVKQEIDKL